MEFQVNLNNIFESNISKINDSLIPSDFSGDRRKAQLVASQIAEIIDAMGIASAKAQGLHHAITSAEKMKNCDHTLYLMIEPNDNNGYGSVVGLLKVGVKNLFLFDKTGMVHEKKSLCVLDFYVHESKQRNGFGKTLYDYMLQDQDIEPCKLAFDEPSQKFLSFLFKHYGQAKIYPQSNNFVLFEGFFNEKNEVISSLESLENNSNDHDRMEKENRKCCKNPSVGSEGYAPTLFGRHTAFKLQDTMREIIGPFNQDSSN